MRSLALALFIFGLIPFILTRPYIGLLAWSWIGYMNPHRLAYGFAYSFPWVQLIAVVTLGSLLLSKEKKRIHLSPIVISLACLFLWSTATTVFAAEPHYAWRLWDQFGKILIMVAVTLMLVKTRTRLHGLVWVIAISLGFYGVKGGLFTILTGGNYHVWGPAHSFIADNNDLALALCMTVPLIRYLQLHAERKIIRVGLGVALLLTCVAILGTYSRGGLIGLGAMGAILVLRSRRRVILLTLIPIVLISSYQFMPAKWLGRMSTIQHAEQVNTLETRIQSWEFASNVAVHHPLMGGGFDVYRSTLLWDLYGPEGAKQRAIHSIYFRMLGEHGFPGLALFVALLFLSWRSCAQVRRATRGSLSRKWAFDLASMLQVSLVPYIVAGLATTQTYFDLTYQLMAMCALLHMMVIETEASTPSRTLDKIRGAIPLHKKHDSNMSS